MFPFPMSSLLTPELLRRLEQFQLLAARRAKSSAKGERRSRARGQSVEFADHRSYVPGDDFRYLDWNLFGRLDKLFLKLYEEERELPVRIFLDASESMTFGEPRKFDFARQVAAAIGYVALCGFDRVSVIPFPSAEFGMRSAESQSAASSANTPHSALRTPHSSEELAARGALRSVRGKKSSMQFFQNLNALTAGGGADFNEALRRGALEARHTGLAIVLSDFLDPAGYEAGLTALVGRGFQVNCRPDSRARRTRAHHLRRPAPRGFRERRLAGSHIRSLPHEGVSADRAEFHPTPARVHDQARNQLLHGPVQHGLAGLAPEAAQEVGGVGMRGRSLRNSARLHPGPLPRERENYSHAF